MRRRVPWLLAVPLMIGGSLGAHALSAALASAPALETGREAAERSSTGAASRLVVPLGVAVALVLLAAAMWARSATRGRRGASAPLFFWLPPLAFTAQELTERLLHAEAAPFHTALEPRFLLGLAFQIPFGVAALLAARMLHRVARRIARALSGVPPVVLLRPGPPGRPPAGWVAPRLAVPALGYSQRGPPAT